MFFYYPLKQPLCFTWETAHVHLFEIFGLQYDDGQFPCRGNVSQGEANVSQLVLLQNKETEQNVF